MTNGEKYVTAQERAKAFRDFCQPNACHDCTKCKVYGDGKGSIVDCVFAWIESESDVEKPLPCPFCGGECESIDFSDYAEGGQVVCETCEYQSRGYETVSKAIAAHNRVAKAVMES